MATLEPQQKPAEWKLDEQAQETASHANDAQPLEDENTMNNVGQESTTLGTTLFNSLRNNQNNSPAIFDVKKPGLPTVPQENAHLTFERNLDQNGKEMPQHDLYKNLPPGTHRCFNYHCPNTVPGAVGELKLTRCKILNDVRWLCPTCHLAYKGKQYCPFCYQFYFQDDAVDDKKWVQCDNAEKECERWIHVDCEEASIKADLLLGDLKKVSYFCPDCRFSLLKGNKASNSGKNGKRKDIKKKGEIKPEEWDQARKKILGRSMKNKGLLFANGMKIVNHLNEVADYQDDMIGHHTNGFGGKLANGFTASLLARDLTNRRIAAARNMYVELSTAIDNILGAFGTKVQLTDNEIHYDLDRLRKVCNKGQQLFEGVGGFDDTSANGMNEEHGGQKRNLKRQSKKGDKKRDDQLKVMNANNSLVNDMLNNNNSKGQHAGGDDEDSSGDHSHSPQQTIRILRSGRATFV